MILCDVFVCLIETGDTLLYRKGAWGDFFVCGMALRVRRGQETLEKIRKWVLSCFLIKSLLRFSGEIESENVGFVRQRRQNQTSSLPLGMYRVAKDASSSLAWACFALRKTMFRTSIGHVSQHKVWF